MANAVVHLNVMDCATIVEALRLYGNAYPSVQPRSVPLAKRIDEHGTALLKRLMPELETELERQQRIGGS